MTAAETDYLTHDHNFLGRPHDENARRTLWVVALTAVMMVGEIVAGPKRAACPDEHPLRRE